MPSSRKINLEKVLASLDALCPKCGKATPPAEVRRIDFERIECPVCGERFSAASVNQKEPSAWAEHLEEAIVLLKRELPRPNMIQSQEYLLSCGRKRGIGPKVMKRAAAKLGIVFEQHVYPVTDCVRTYWKLPH